MMTRLTKNEGLMLYWCEGDKPTQNHMVAVTSTTPEILSLFIGWLNEYYEIQPNRLNLRLHLWEDSNEEECKAFWRNALGVDHFTKSYIKKSGKHKKYKNGVCRVSFGSKKVCDSIASSIHELWCELK